MRTIHLGLAGLTGAIFIPLACGGSGGGFVADGSAGDSGSDAAAGAGGAAGSGSGGTSTGGSAGAGGGSGGAGGGSGGAAGAGGAGGAAGGTAGAGGGAAAAGTPGCVDVDGDGACVGPDDCDDSDPNNYAANAEQCGDNADNNCNNVADENCSGLGTWVSALTGDDMNPGTQASPVQTIRQGIQNAQTIGGGVDVFVAEGDYPEKVTMVEGIDLLGGHQCDTSSCTWARDSATHASRIVGQDAEGVVAHDSITRATRIDGFRIFGSNGGGAGEGRVAITVDGGSPTITNNVINGPDVTGGNFRDGRSIGVLVLAPTSGQGALIESNTINGGTSSANSTLGVLLDRRQGPTGATSLAVIRQNTIIAGDGRNSNGIAAWSAGAGTLIQDNEVSAGTASGGTSWGIIMGSTLDVDGNRVNTVRATVGTCNPQNPNWCGGIASLSATASITNNIALGVGGSRSAGIMLFEAEMPAGSVVLNGNTAVGSPLAGGSGGESAALVLRIGQCTTCGFNARIGKVRNNVLVAGSGSPRYGVFEDAAMGQTQEPEAFENNLIFLMGGASGNDALYSEWDGSNATLHTTIAAVDGMSIPGNGPVGGNVDADPMLDAMWHLMSGSPAIDAGTPTEAPSNDIDGDSRPRGSGIDIGADEAG